MLTGMNADDAEKRGRAVTKPFRGTWETAFTDFGAPIPGCDDDPTTGPFTIEGHGQAIHMGNTLYTSVSESDFVTQCGSGTMTAANGDQLFVEFSGNVNFPPPPETFGTFAGEFSFTGGTGRFENATGGGTYEGSADVVTQQGLVTYTGIVTY
jgi:hypothetical protein